MGVTGSGFSGNHDTRLPSATDPGEREHRAHIARLLSASEAAGLAVACDDMACEIEARRQGITNPTSAVAAVRRIPTARDARWAEPRFRVGFATRATSSRVDGVRDWLTTRLAGSRWRSPLRPGRAT